MSSVQQEVVGRIQFCPHDHMIDTGHAGNCGRASQLICDTSRRMVLEFLPGMQDFAKIQSRLIHETYIHHSALYYSAVTLGACRSVCGPGVALTATFVHVKVQCVPLSGHIPIEASKGFVNAKSPVQHLNFCDEHMMPFIPYCIFYIF